MKLFCGGSFAPLKHMNVYFSQIYIFLEYHFIIDRKNNSRTPT